MKLDSWILIREGKKTLRSPPSAVRYASMVGVRGLEPPASWSQTTRSSQLSYTPRFVIGILANKGSLVKSFCYNDDVERFYSKIVGTPVYEDGGQRPITTVKDVVVDPEVGKLLAFVVNLNKSLVITPVDVLSWTEVIKVHNNDAIASSDEVLRVAQVMAKHVNIFHNKVYTKSGEYLGKVNDFSIDSNVMMLQKLYLSKGFLGLIRYQSRIISAKNILEILPDRIVIKDETPVKEAMPEREVALDDMAIS